jgi:putative membrane protein
MDLGFYLAIAHHLAVFSLVGIFAAEFTLIRPGINVESVQRLARIDAVYGGLAGAVIVIGILRVLFGGTDPWYYLTNFAFWGKMGAFLVMGLMTLPPTMAIRRWKADSKLSSAYEPPKSEVGTARRFVHLQAVALLFIPIFAAAMARGYGS